MFLDEDFIIIARLVLMGAIGLLIYLKWLHYYLFRKNHGKESIRLRLFSIYGQRETYATGSANKRNFMIASNRMLYLICLLIAVLLMLLIIPLVA